MKQSVTTDPAAPRPAPRPAPACDADRPDLVRVLSQRFGDGLVYLRESGERAVLERAVRRGLVSRDGYLTPAGLSLLAAHGEV